MNLDPALCCHPGVLYARLHINDSKQEFVTSIGTTLIQRTCLQALRASRDVKHPMVSFAKSREVIADTLAKFRIPARVSVSYRFDMKHSQDKEKVKFTVSIKNIAGILKVS